ncbi:BatA domain-containing protein [Sphingobium sp.]|uniref:BatA domain-containing protein n=1 Tax=Sphingobium sp. TaxID=1912891 RepID=UPI003B3BCBC9
MTLLFPAALAALTALIVPLILHIARRREQLLTEFAALRWLRQKPRPRSRLRFDERFLLLIRLLLLLLVVVWLTNPVLFGATDRRPYVAIIPGASFDPAVFKDSRLHWLAPGFPAIDRPQPVGSLPVASLIRQIDAELPAGTPLTIVAPAIIAGADAERPRLSRKIVWQVTPGTMAWPKTETPVPPALSVRWDEGHRSALPYIQAAASAWQPGNRSAHIDSRPVDAPLPDDRHTLIWLAGGSVPEKVLRWASDGGTVIMANDAVLPKDNLTVPLWRDEGGVPLADGLRFGKGRLLHFTRQLRPSDMPILLEPDFPAQFGALIEPTPAPDRVAAVDYAPVGGARFFDQPPQSLRSWLALLIAGLLLIERWMATRRNRSTAP